MHGMWLAQADFSMLQLQLCVSVIIWQLAAFLCLQGIARSVMSSIQSHIRSACWVLCVFDSLTMLAG